MQLLGQRDRNSFIVLGQRDKLKILPQAEPGWISQSKPWMGHGMGQGFDILPQNRLGREFDSLSRPVSDNPGTTTGQKGKKSKTIEKQNTKFGIKVL